MQTDCTQIPYQQTGFFSKIVNAYLDDEEAMRTFYQHSVTLQGLAEAIAARQAFAQNRALLVAALQQQYAGLTITPAGQQNIQLLGNTNTFTITTAHQPNIFTGPVYFIYKILHAIKLASHLSTQLPAYNFVPVYYMGSEDADLDELGSITINGEKYSWQTKQTGAVGRMKVDKNFTALIHRIHGQIGVEEFGGEMTDLFNQCYREGTTIQQATLELVNALFGKYGLLVVVPDNADLKRSFSPIIKKELVEGFSHTIVSATLAEFEKHYKPQAGGRAINLFYLINDKRERIEKERNNWVVKSLQIEWAEEDILKELDEHPERFSPNVILRGVFQETILPNIAFIGGGGELAYWLELKRVFAAVNVPYPVLVLRNSFLLVAEKWRKKQASLGFETADLFKSELALMDKVVAERSANKFYLNGELTNIEEVYDGIKAMTTKVDPTLAAHVEALKIKAVKRLLDLEKKLKSAEKKKFSTELAQIQKLKASLFPNNNLQERVENYAGFYAKHGLKIMDALLDASLTIEQQFVVMNIL